MVSSVKLDAHQDLRIPITLKIAAASPLIEVSAAPDQINTENGTLSDSISGRHENDLRETLRHLSQSISN